jgi:hypothetical protein
MERFRGKLMQNGQVVADSVEGSMTVDLEISGAQSWSGYFTLPMGQSVNNGETYDLALEDGRCQAIRISRVNAWPDRPVSASFVSGNITSV